MEKTKNELTYTAFEWNNSNTLQQQNILLIIMP